MKSDAKETEVLSGSREGRKDHRGHKVPAQVPTRTWAQGRCGAHQAKVGRKRFILLFSGGSDTTTLLYWMLRYYRRHYEQRNWKLEDQILCVYFDYGQRRAIVKSEWANVQRHCRKLGIECELHSFTYPPLLQRHSKLFEGQGYGTCCVEHRNTLFVLYASIIAKMRRASYILIGNTRSEEGVRELPVYLDTTPEWEKVMNVYLATCMNRPPHLVAPMNTWAKYDVLEVAHELGLTPDDFVHCHYGTNCGKCRSCRRMVYEWDRITKHPEKPDW